MPRSLFLSMALVCASPAFAQSESPQRLVKLNVAAITGEGEPVTDLTSGDLTVREDGKPRPIVFFRFAGSKRLVEPPGTGEFVNRPSVTPTVILFDRWNEQLMTAAAAWTGLGPALERLESVNRVYIYFLTAHGDLFPVHPLPATDADLRAAPDPSAAELRAALDEAVRKLQGFRAVDVKDPLLRANTTFQTLGTLGVQMASLAGRKNLIWVTHGIPLNARTLSGSWADFTPQVRSLSAASAQAQIAIYTVDQSAGGAAANPSSQARATLQMFSALTGGRWYPSDNFERAMSESVADSRGDYVVAYYSQVHEKDHKEHKIRLDSARKGVHLLTREAYFGDTVEPDPDALETAVFSVERRSPIDASEVGLRVDVAPNHITIHVDPADVLLGEDHHAHLGMMLAFYSGGFLKETSNVAHVEVDATKNEIVIPEDLPSKDKIQTIEKIRVMVFDRGLHSLGSVTIPVR